MKKIYYLESTYLIGSRLKNTIFFHSILDFLKPYWVSLDAVRSQKAPNTWTIIIIFLDFISQNFLHLVYLGERAQAVYFTKGNAKKWIVLSDCPLTATNYIETVIFMTRNLHLIKFRSLITLNLFRHNFMSYTVFSY